MKVEKLKSYLKQPSTWIGIVALLSLLGVKITPEMIEKLPQACLVMVGLYEIIRDEGK